MTTLSCNTWKVSISVEILTNHFMHKMSEIKERKCSSKISRAQVDEMQRSIYLHTCETGTTTLT